MKKWLLLISMCGLLILTAATCKGKKPTTQEASPNYGNEQQVLDSIKAAKMRAKKQGLD